MTKDELILSLCNEKDLGIGGSNEELIQTFRETYKDQADLVTKVAQGDAKTLRRLRSICGLKVITQKRPLALKEVIRITMRRGKLLKFPSPIYKRGCVNRI